MNIVKLVLISTFVISSSTFAANILRLNAYKSPIGINWKNPKKLSRMTAINTLIAGKHEYGHTLGHLSISVMCENGVEFHTGMERTDLSESKNLVFKKGAGLGTLVHNFKGNIEDEKKVVSSVNYSVDKKNGRDLNFVEFLISDTACARAYEYYKAFKESKTWLNYGMTNNPRLCEGSGCTAYGKSYLEIVGFDDDSLLQKWRGEVGLPRNILGTHSTKLYKDSHAEGNELIDTGYNVKILKLTNPFAKRIKWDDKKNKEDSVTIMYYSPDYMHKWIKKEYRNKKSPYAKRKYKKGSRSKVITIDISDIETPTEPFFERNCDEVLNVDVEKFTK
jgi:hypothetical protein